MVEMNTRKKLATGILALSLLVIAGCGEAKELPKADSNEVLKGAREALVTDLNKTVEEKSTGAGTARFDLDVAIPEGSVKAAGTMDSQSTAGKTDTDPMNSSAKLATLINVATPEIKGSADISAEFKMIDKIFYLYLDKLDLKSEDEKLKEYIAQAKAFLDLYSKKWFKIDLVKYAAQMGSTNALQTMSKEDTKKIVESIKSNEIFEVIKELPSSEGMYIYQVKPRADGIQAIMKTIISVSPAKEQWSDSDDAKLKEFVTLLGGDKFIHTLYVDGTTKKYKKFTTTGSVDADKAEGTLEIMINSPKEQTVDIQLKGNINEKGDKTKNGVLTLDARMEGTAGSIKASFDLPSEKVKASFNATSTFEKKNITVETPADATDLASLLSAFGLGASASAPIDTEIKTPATNTNAEAMIAPTTTNTNVNK